MRAGLSSYAFTWGVGVPGTPPPQPLGPVDLVDETARLELEVLQLADNVPVVELDDEALDRLREHAAARAVTLELGGRGLTAAALDRHVAVARRLNARALRFVVDGPDHEPPAGEVVELLRAARETLEDAEVTLALENHDRLTVAELAAVVRAADSPHIGICLDTVNSIGAGEGLSEVLRELGPLTVDLHVKDFAIARRRHGMGFHVVGACLGRGMLDLPAVLGEVARHGRCTSAVLEQWAPERPNLAETLALERDWVQRGATVLRQAVQACRPTPQHQGAR